MASSTYTRALKLAAELIGGQAKLRRHLRVPAADLQEWIEDRSVPPMAVFLRVVDLIIEETAPPAESNPVDPPTPRDCSPAGDSSATRF